jgi:selenocysteine lyase/cysteine desulfurase
MPNYPAVYAIRAGLEYIKSVGVTKIDEHARPLVLQCLEELKKLPIELLTPDEPEHIAGILAFKHPKAEEIHAKLHAKNVHVMSHAGRIRIAIHGYNTADDIEKLVKELKAALK